MRSPKLNLQKKNTSKETKDDEPKPAPIKQAYEYYCDQRRPEALAQASLKLDNQNIDSFLESEWQGLSDYSKKTYNEMQKKDKERWEQATSKHRIHEVREKKRKTSKSSTTCRREIATSKKKSD